MTEIRFELGEGGSLEFECENHAGDSEVCMIVSTLCNVLVSSFIRSGLPIDEYESGKVLLYTEKANYPLVETFRTVVDVLEEVSSKYPENVKLYI